MSTTMFFKQWFKSRSDPSTPGLNVRHLQYIATRPGAVYNRGCGFGLWGQLPGDSGGLVQTDLDKAKRIVRAASQEHTLYRAIFSVGKKDAQEHGLYSRERWEKLVGDHIRDIAREMNIKPENMCWCASFHCAKGHPHVHILYWDNGPDPRQEYVPKPLWDAKAERIRAAFAGDIHREEIREQQKEQRERIRPLRTAIQAMCREANPEKALDLPRLYKSATLGDLSQRLGGLLRDVPAKGSLRYAYLPPDYKARVDELVEACLKVPELAAELEKYDRCTREISRLYANGKSGGQRNFEKAREKLRRELGNQVMDAIREVQREVRSTAPANMEQVRELIQDSVREIVPTLESYQSLKALLPPERIPVSRIEWQIEGYHEQLNHVVGDVLSDARVRLRLQGYALTAAGIDLASKPDAKKHEPAVQASPEENAGTAAEKHRLFGKEVEDSEWEAYQETYRETRRALREAVTDWVRQDAGWTREAVTTATANMLVNMMRVVSQAAYQRQAGAVQARNNLKTRSKDRSREAKKDYWHTQELGGGQWGDGYHD